MSLDLEGEQIVDEDFEFALALTTDHGVKLRVETAFDVDTPEDRRRLVPDDPALGWWGRLSLVGTKIAECSQSDSGELRVSLSNGMSMTVQPDEQFEAWTLSYPSGRKVICGPGGEITTFG
jgi:Family of unknown function (DUF6188)